MNIDDVYSVIATHFDETRHTPWPSVLEFIKAQTGADAVLDLGCGNGKYLPALLEAAKHVSACDPCVELLACAKAKVSESDKERVEFAMCSGNWLPYADASFDAVICIAVFHHLRSVLERQTFMAQIARVLKPQGSAYLTVWNTPGIKWRHVNDSHDANDYYVPWHDKHSGRVYDRFYHVLSVGELFELAHGAGLRITTLRNERGNWHVVLEPSV